jgi:hypothetical protein
VSAALAVLAATIPLDAVLAHYGFPSPRPGRRMTCPIHGGRNPSAFAVRESRFRCFSCDAHGDVIDLERALGGGTAADAIRRLRERHGIEPGRVDPATIRRRRRRLARLTAWHRNRSNEWTTALVRAEAAVRQWQCDPAEADAAWAELDRRCTARDRAEAMVETFTQLRTVEERATAFAVEQRGAVCLPWDGRC